MVIGFFLVYLLKQQTLKRFRSFSNKKQLQMVLLVLSSSSALVLCSDEVVGYNT